MAEGSENLRVTITKGLDESVESGGRLFAKPCELEGGLAPGFLAGVSKTPGQLAQVGAPAAGRESARSQEDRGQQQEGSSHRGLQHISWKNSRR